VAELKTLTLTDEEAKVVASQLIFAGAYASDSGFPLSQKDQELVDRVLAELGWKELADSIDNDRLRAIERLESKASKCA
jgi:hypothetical protein